MQLISESTNLHLKKDQGESVRVTFYAKELIRSLKIGVDYNENDFLLFFGIISIQNFQSFYEVFARAAEAGVAMGGGNFGKILIINVPKGYSGQFHVF